MVQSGENADFGGIGRARPRIIQGAYGKWFVRLKTGFEKTTGVLANGISHVRQDVCNDVARFQAGLSGVAISARC